jgi:hypothetical protein
MQQSTNDLYALAIIFVKLVKEEKAAPHGEANTLAPLCDAALYFLPAVSSTPEFP